MPPRAPRAFYRTDPVTLARGLLGCILVRSDPRAGRLSATIVETEAYLGIRDAAAHSYRGRRTRRNERLYGPPGTAYIYFTYGMHHCFNIVGGAVGEQVAALISAAEPVEGIGAMRRSRARGRRRRSRAGAGAVGEVGVGQRGRRAPLPQEQLCAGPAKLCEAFGLTRALDGIDLATSDQMWVEPAGPLAAGEIAASPRIGVAYAGDWALRPLRFRILGNPHVSRPA
jgi:DNA-3-methyladenine glycosylase